jgi:hypothetical protein
LKNPFRELTYEIRLSPWALKFTEITPLAPDAQRLVRRRFRCHTDSSLRDPLGSVAVAIACEPVANAYSVKDCPLAPVVGGARPDATRDPTSGIRFPETGSSLPITVQIFTTTHKGFGNIFIQKAK